MNKPLVSVFMITYNHEKYLGAALDSILMQQVNFDYEIVVGEDCSSDNTRAILLQYAEKFPEKFKLLLHQTNIGAHQNQILTHQACRGKYIALLEGDDYWTDPLKLQKQVDFLENNPDYMIAFHRAYKLFESDGRKEATNPVQKKENTIEDLFVENFICTATCTFRNGFLKQYPDFFFQTGAGDWVLHILNAQYGKIYFMEDMMAVYRIHGGGAIATAVSSPEKLRKALSRDILTFEAINKYFNFKYQNLVEKLLARIYKQLALLSIQENNRKEAFKNTLLSLKLFFSFSTFTYLMPLVLSPSPKSTYKLIKKIKS